MSEQCSWASRGTLPTLRNVSASMYASPTSRFFFARALRPSSIPEPRSPAVAIMITALRGTVMVKSAMLENAGAGAGSWARGRVYLGVYLCSGVVGLMMLKLKLNICVLRWCPACTYSPFIDGAARCGAGIRGCRPAAGPSAGRSCRWTRGSSPLPPSPGKPSCSGPRSPPGLWQAL